MKKIAYTLGLSALLLGTTGCSGEEANSTKTKEVVEAKTEITTVAKEEKKAPNTINEEEAKSLLEETMGKLISTLDSLKEKYDWNINGTPPEMDVIKKEIASITTNDMTDNYSENLYNYFSDTDTGPMPTNIRPDVRVDVEQKDNELVVGTLTLANDMVDATYIQFGFVYEDETWKLEGWAYDVIVDFELTQEEAQTIVNQLGDHTYTFKEEKEENGVKHYVFDADEVSVSVNSATTYVTYHYEEKDEPVAQEEVTQQNTEDSSNNKLTNLSKDEWMQKLDDVMAKESYQDKDFDDVEAWETDTQHNFKLWDDFLNEVYGALKANLDSEEFEILREEQREWVSYRDPMAESKAVDSVGGTDHPLYNAHVTDWKAGMTYERCYVLINSYME